MTTEKLRKIGGSTILATSPSIRDAMRLSVNASADRSAEKGTLVETRACTRRTLDQILSECDAVASDEDREWLKVASGSNLTDGALAGGQR